MQGVLLLPVRPVGLCEVGLAEAIGSSYATVDGVPLVRGLGVAGFATHTLVPERSVVKIPEEADLELAALIGCALSTGVGAVFRTARVAPGSSVAVVGCGGVGLSVIQGAKIAGASRIIAVDRLAAKLDLARSLGATDLVDASSVDAVAESARLRRAGEPTTRSRWSASRRRSRRRSQ